MYKFKLILLIVISFVLSGCTYIGLSNHDIEITGDKSFIDSRGNSFTVDEPFNKVITLYSAHTENIFTIGGGEQIIGVNSTSIYPPQASKLKMYDYRGDPEAIIASDPDLVIIRPFIYRNYRSYVRAIEKAGIPVVSLYPDSQEAFEPYIKSLGIIFGKEEEANDQIDLYYKRLEDIKTITKDIPESEKVNVYFESTKTAYRTVTLDSNPAKAIEMAGGINIAQDVKPITRGSTISEFGIEKLMINSENIDVFVSQRGAMNAGGSIISIPQREGFKAIKAVEEGRILEINEKIISSPTFRYYKGVNELARAFYPSLMDDYSKYQTDKLLSRRDYANLIVKFTNTPIFIPSSSRYYEKNHKVHTFGMFVDIPWTDEDFDYIETAVLNSFIKGYKDGNEYFLPDQLITRADIAYTLYIIYDIKGLDKNIKINDIEMCIDDKIIQKIVDNKYMFLDENGNFNPNENVSGNDVIKILLRGQDIND